MLPFRASPDRPLWPRKRWHKTACQHEKSIRVLPVTKTVWQFFPRIFAEFAWENLRKRQNFLQKSLWKWTNLDFTLNFLQKMQNFVSKMWRKGNLYIYIYFYDIRFASPRFLQKNICFRQDFRENLRKNISFQESFPENMFKKKSICLQVAYKFISLFGKLLIIFAEVFAKTERVCSRKWKKTFLFQS